MYVISITSPTALSTGGLAANTEQFWPADRCLYRTEYNTTTDQYEVHGLFYQGGGSLVPAPSGSTVALGVVGKSGRFVPITGYRTTA